MQSLRLHFPAPKQTKSLSQFRIKTLSLVLPHTNYSHYNPYPRSQTHLLPSYPVTVTKRSSTMTVIANMAVQGDADGGTSVAEEEPMPPELRLELMPKHVAVIMDGNGRWAKMRGLPPWEGHEAGVRSLKRLVRLCRSWGVKVLTVFAFSTDNWVEVDFLMRLFERTINSEVEAFMRAGIRISVIGDSSKLPKSLKRMITSAEESTKDNSELQLIVAVSYSGKYDVVQACRSVAKRVKDGHVDLEDIDENMIEQELETNCTEFPNPDLLIRTSGELRVSNFLLWQLAYTELFFNRELWPDFGKEEFVEALNSFQQRQRRYGGRHS
ncbi:dehydrodolichyl diphosphate synthase 2-like isoform X2 [Lotus japonicus]|uniref:dehydrodolichyl diphosphate synthase 2-like isoform X2 n=1 Tax=Lotus japonicus TaxID=34305 RepID=UPI00258A0228|nr:dehydrodolichyl diphosphate synthase 2-like isoform X2 [Lotus japonicus]